MQLKHFFFLLSFAFSVVASAQGSLPDVSIKTLDGKTVNVQDLGGHCRERQNHGHKDLLLGKHVLGQYLTNRLKKQGASDGK